MEKIRKAEMATLSIQTEASKNKRAQQKEKIKVVLMIQNIVLGSYIIIYHHLE
jgi:hypothetical protein